MGKPYQATHVASRRIAPHELISPCIMPQTAAKPPTITFYEVEKSIRCYFGAHLAIALGDWWDDFSSGNGRLNSKATSRPTDR